MTDPIKKPAICREGGCTGSYVRYRMKSPSLIEADWVDVLTGEVEEITVSSPSGAGQRIAGRSKCKVAV